MDIKIVAAVISTIVAAAAFWPYITDTLKRKTQPHIYTWLIWFITQGTATAGIWYGGGKWGAIELTVGTILVLFVFILSLKYGSKNITKSDTFFLVIALSAIVVWWQLKNPLLAVLMVTSVDIMGYLPTMRKTFQEPWSETLSSWICFAIGNLFSVVALKEYNLLTFSFLIATTIANAIVVLICMMRRPMVLKPANP